MKILHAILSTLLHLALLLAALALLAVGIWGIPERFADIALRPCLVHSWRGIVAGSAALLYLALYALSARLARTRRQVIAFENDDGRVTVDTEAVRSYLSGLKDEFAAANWIKPSVSVVKGALRVSIVLGVKPGTQIPELCRLIQNRVKEIVQEHLGTCDLAGIEMDVREIVGPRRPLPSAPADSSSAP